MTFIKNKWKRLLLGLKKSWIKAMKQDIKKWRETQRKGMLKYQENLRKKRLAKLKAGTLYPKVVFRQGKKFPANKARKMIIKELDELWSLKVREKCQCELCGRKGNIKSFDAHHIKGRSRLSTRWDLENGACLCKGCHRFKVHMDTLTASILIQKLKDKRGKMWYNELVEKANMITKYSIQDLENIKLLLTKTNEK
jgi:hypothetical protein